MPRAVLAAPTLSAALLLAACTPTPPPAPPAPPPPEPLPRATLSTIEASSQLTAGEQTFAAANAFDGDTTTAWCEGVDGLGAGEALMVTLRSTVDLAAIEIDAGYYKDDRTLNNNGRPRRITIVSDAGWTAEARFAHQPNREHALPKINVPPTRVEAPGAARTLTFRLDEADAGRVTEDVCISRIVLYGR